MPLALVMPPAPLGSVVVAGLLVVGGAVAMTFLAIAMAAGGADLSDEQTHRRRPGDDLRLSAGRRPLQPGPDRRSARRASPASALYLFVTAAYWGAGVARAEICLDAEAVRTPRLRTADAATLLLIYALGSRGLGTAAARGARWRRRLNGMRLGWAVLLGLVALALLRRAPPLPERRGLAVSAIVEAPSWARRRARFAGGAAPRRSLRARRSPYWIGVGSVPLAEEVIFRGVLQRSLEQDLAPSVSIAGARALEGAPAAGVLTAALGIVALAMTTAPSTRLTRLTISLQVAATLVRGVTGRVSAAWLARLAGLAVCTFL